MVTGHTRTATDGIQEARTVTIPTRRRAARPAATRLAWALCVLSVALAVASVGLAFFNGENLLELVANHHAIGILDALVLSVVGALIVVRDRRHLLAWLLLVDSLLLATFNFASQYGLLALGLTSRHVSLPGGELCSWLAGWTNLPGIVLGVVFLVLLFPDGRLPSRRWWPLAVAGAVTAVVPTVVLAVGYWPLRGPELFTDQGELPALVGGMFWLAFAGSLVLGAISVVGLVLRFRRAGAVQRQQIKWFAYGAVLSIPLSLFPEADPWGPYAEFLGTVLLLGGLGIGILRYRLWDIDRLVNRTLVYGLVTVILGGTYALGVLVLGQAVSAGRRPSSLVVAATTLVVAALFQPLRRRVQRAVDRRFNRRHYDAARTIEAFATRLRAQVDLPALAAELLAVADHTLQPTQVSLWLAQPPTWMAGRRRGSSSTSRSTSRVTGAVSPWPNSR
jgi:hypothetical protein